MSNQKKPKFIRRNEYGLIEDLEYPLNEEGFIDWRKIINPKFLVSKDKSAGSDVSSMKDSELLILLRGIKELAQIRGFTDVSYEVVSPSPEYVIAICKIKWIPNYETENREVSFSGIGDASFSNTDNFARNFLAAIAENRSFVRCVRNFLKIDIVGKEEMGPTVFKEQKPILSSDSVANPREFLRVLMSEKEIDFKEIKEKLLKENFENAERFLEIEDIPIIKTLELIERLKKIK